MSKQRPLSPHLQIYRPEITSILSIFHRITGIALSVGSLLLVLWVFTLSLGKSYYEFYMMLSQSSVGIFILIGFTFALNYHLSNGIRHLFWDFGHGFELKTVYKSGFAVVLFATILTVFIWINILSN
tara:strand:- start:282 stop:662 length:381 start_codon:yes stop_codon:yes gene_type:complete